MNLIKLAKLEWLKFKSNPVIVALTVGFTLIFPFVIFSGKEVFKSTRPPFPSSSIFYEFPTVWDYQGYAGNWLVSFFLGFMMIHLITSEVGFRTMRQNIITGLNRREYFISKIISMVAISLGATIIYYISSIVIGIIHTEGWDMALVLDNNFAGFRFFFMCIGYLSFAFLISFLIRRGSLSLLMYFATMMFIEPILRGLYYYFTRHHSQRFFPLNAIEDLMPNPILRLPDFMKTEDFNFSILLSYNQAFLLSAFYIALFFILAWRIFSKKDL